MLNLGIGPFHAWLTQAAKRLNLCLRTTMVGSSAATKIMKWLIFLNRR